jgi:hypothetical protein
MSGLGRTHIAGQLLVKLKSKFPDLLELPFGLCLWIDIAKIARPNLRRQGQHTVGNTRELRQSAGGHILDLVALDCTSFGWRLRKNMPESDVLLKVASF